MNNLWIGLLVRWAGGPCCRPRSKYSNCQRLSISGVNACFFLLVHSMTGVYDIAGLMAIADIGEGTGKVWFSLLVRWFFMNIPGR